MAGEKPPMGVFHVNLLSNTGRGYSTQGVHPQDPNGAFVRQRTDRRCQTRPVVPHNGSGERRSVGSRDRGSRFPGRPRKRHQAVSLWETRQFVERWSGNNLLKVTNKNGEDKRITVNHSHLYPMISGITRDSKGRVLRGAKETARPPRKTRAERRTL